MIDYFLSGVWFPGPVAKFMGYGIGFAIGVWWFSRPKKGEH